MFMSMGAKVSTDHHLVVCNLLLEKPAGPNKRAGPGNPTE